MGFKGGYTFKNFEGSAEPVLTALGIPDTVVFPVPDGYTPTASAGDTVSAGTPVLNDPAGNGPLILSSVNGKIQSLDDNRLVISADGSDSFQPVDGHTREPWHLAHADAVALAGRSGILPLLGENMTGTEACEKVTHIIINAVHNAPLDQKWSPGIYGDSALIGAGLKSLKALFPNAAMVITTNGRNKDALSRLDIGEMADIRVLADRYPQEHPELLCRDALGIRLVQADGTNNPSIVVTTFEILVQVAECMTLGRPLIDRIVMVAGPGVSRPGWYRIRIGSPYEFIVGKLCKSPKEQQHWRIIRNGLFAGSAVDTKEDAFTISDSEISAIREIEVRELWRFMNPGFDYDAYSPVTAAAFLPFIPKRVDSALHGGERPCVQCNFCDMVCPVDIYPFLIWKLTGVDKIEETYRLKAHDCVGCGLCDYVCPSKINLSAAVQQARNEYYKSGSVDESAD